MQSHADYPWTLLAAALVFFMQAGFALVERTKFIGYLVSAMKILTRSLEMQRGCVFLLDPISKELRIVAGHGLTRAEIERGGVVWIRDCISH